jgi:hypothetical protein
MHRLFHADNGSFFDMAGLRALARAEVESSSLIGRCAGSDRAAAVALSIGFWPFVYDFEKAIDSKANSSGLPREPLYAKFKRGTTRRVLADTARAVRELQESEIAGVFGDAEEAVREMQHEEKTHSAYWAKDAENLAISRSELDGAEVVPGVKALIESAYASDLVQFFAALAATEFIAEELAEHLAHAKPYQMLFARKRAIWMEVHTIPHDDGPSHLEIDMDLARAYDQVGDAKRIEDLVANTTRLFGAAAREVEAHFCPTQVIAAE